jgi:hypothetical protein
MEISPDFPDPSVTVRPHFEPRIGTLSRRRPHIEEGVPMINPEILMTLDRQTYLCMEG